MRLLVISDIHADADGLQLVLEDSRDHGWDQVLLLGDLIGYGNQPRETLEIVRSLDVFAAVTGNHEHMLGRLRDGVRLNVSKALLDSLELCLLELGAEQLDWLAALPESQQLAGLQVVHGSPVRRFDYVLGSVDARKAEPYLLEPLCLIGHSHLPGLFLKADADSKWEARPARRSVHTWLLPHGVKAILNPGSVWLNRDRTGGSSYGILELGSHEERSFTVQRI